MADEDKIVSLAQKFELEEDEVRKLSDKYKEADNDGSGSIDRDELKVLLRKTIPKKITDKGLDRFLESQWQNIDNDGSGAMDFEEFLSLYNICFKQSQAKPESPAPDTPHVYESSPSVNTTSDKPHTLVLKAGQEEGQNSSVADESDNNSPIMTITKTVTIDETSNSSTPNQTPTKEKKQKRPSSEMKKKKVQNSSVTTFSTPPPKSKGANDRSAYSPTISPHSAHSSRSGDVFEKLYNDALQRRERRKTREEEFGKKGVESSSTGPSLTNMANKMNRSGDVWTSLYNDSIQRRERREEKQAV